MDMVMGLVGGAAGGGSKPGQEAKQINANMMQQGQGAMQVAPSPLTSQGLGGMFNLLHQGGGGSTAYQAPTTSQNNASQIIATPQAKQGGLDLTKLLQLFS